MRRRAISFVVGWSGDATAETPDVLDVTLDKTDYKPGEHDEAAHRLALRRHGDDRHYRRQDCTMRTIVDLKKGDNDVTLPVGADWGTGAYAVVFAHRPLDQAPKRMPGRALGLAWFGIDRASAQARRLARRAGKDRGRASIGTFRSRSRASRRAKRPM